MTRRRFFLIIAAILTLSVGIAATPAIAQDDAPCCFTFTNSMSCTIRFCVRTPNGPTCVTVPGNTQVTLTVNTDCTNPTVYVVDACGNERVVPVNGCVIANLGNCCPRICLNSGPTRCWQITTSPSPICYACPHDQLN